METQITVQVQCLKPSWVNYENNNYRLYVNNDLITERTWIWNLNSVIEENFWVNIEMGANTTVKLEPVLVRNSVAQFGLRRLKVNEIPMPDFGGESTHLSFTI